MVEEKNIFLNSKDTQTSTNSAIKKKVLNSRKKSVNLVVQCCSFWQNYCHSDALLLRVITNTASVLLFCGMGKVIEEFLCSNNNEIDIITITY